MPHRYGVRPGDTTKCIMALLRERGPLSTPEIIHGVMEHRELNTEDRGLYGVIRNRVKATLRSVRAREAVATSTLPQGILTWHFHSN